MLKAIKSFSNPDQGILYLVATPIGNLDEISKRTREVLEEADLIACEDTRVSSRLLHHLQISKPLIAHHEHNQQGATQKILEALKENKKVAVLSDAGYPLISDPGDLLVEKVLQEGIPVVPISGANAAINALVASGLPANHYLYYGFLDAKSARRKKELEKLKDFPYTMIFYEAPHRIEATLADMLAVLGNRKICLARELTKLYEEFVHGQIEEVLEVVSSLKGEMVVIVEGYHQEKSSVFEQALQQARNYLDEGMKLKEACKKAAAEFEIGKNELYARLLQEKE